MLPDNILKAMPVEERRKLGKAGMTSDDAQLKLEATSERILQRQINGWLRIQQSEGRLIFNWNRSDKRTTCKIGWPDYSIFANQQCLFIEVKFAKGKVSPEQAALHTELALHGFDVRLVTTFEAAINAVKSLIKEQENK
jgi:hypothetical protein